MTISVKLRLSIVVVGLFLLSVATPAYSTPVSAIDFSTSPDTFLAFDTASPGTQTVINPAFSPPISVFGLDFNSLATTLYGIDNVTRTLGAINTTSGVFSPLTVVTGILSNHNITGLSVDPTTDTIFIYSVHGFGGTNPGALYTLNPTTGVASLIGTQGLARLVTDIAINSAGQIFANDLTTDSLYSIDKTTGVATLIGSFGLGFDMFGGGQGMDFDFTTGTLYGVLSGSGQSRFGTINTTTGLFSPLADFGGRSMEIAIAASARAPIPEPGTLLLIGSGLAGLGVSTRLRNQKKR